MPYARKKKKKKKDLNWVKRIPWFLLLLFVIAFRVELFGFLELVFKFFLAILKYFVGWPTGDLPVENWKYIRHLSFNFFLGFGFVFLFWAVLIASQALLPVGSFRDVYRSVFNLILHMFHLHGQAVFIKDGKKLATAKELEKQGSGVVVIDFNSAVVLEEEVPKPNLLRDLIYKFFQGLDLIDPLDTPRAKGPGLVFTRPSERIRDAVDLREQFRMRMDVRAYTRDGIELKTNVNSVFTIGQEPDVLQVSYQGEPRKENLKVVALESLSDGLIRAKSYSDELDEADTQEIHHVARVADKMGILEPYSFLDPPLRLPLFDPERVTAAVFSQAMDENGDLTRWFDLPAMVAVDIYREKLSHINYDDLYLPDREDFFPMPDFKRELRLTIRNLGLLSYRLVFQRSYEPLEVGGVYHQDDLLVSEVMPLTSPKVLRNCGIKVIASGLGDLIPVSDAVYQQRLDTWRAKWDKETDIARANRELIASRIRSRARARTQYEFSQAISQIFASTEYSKEIMAIRVLQALENVAADPETRQLLPADTIRLLGSVHNWLLPEERTPGQPLGGGNLL